MTNKYVVVNKWTTSDANSPGYMSGFEMGGILYEIDQQGVNDVLQSRGIDPAYFDLTIYQNYAAAAQAMRGVGEIQFFAKAKSDHSLCFSLLVYADQQDDALLNDTISDVVQNTNAARTAYMQLVNLECETRRGYKDIDDDILISMQDYQTLTADQAQTIFNSLS